MDKRYSGFFVLVAAIAALYGLAILCAPFLARSKAYRDWRVQQTRPLTDGISMRIEGTYILSESGYRLFRVWSLWQGGNMADNYDVRAAIRTTPEFKETPPAPYWYVPLPQPDPPKEGTLFLWEFHAPKSSPERIWLRVFFRPKHSAEKERWVDFDFPYFPAEDPATPNESITLKDVLPK